MSMAMRKLQAEVDKTLKAITLGVETFDSTFAKLDHATNSTQRNKIEDDLKTQIKKLQRLRDQIKAWLGNNDIKDKNPLIENRKLIESQMERFKALEKEMKMKAYSKEGLIAQSQLAPAEKHKREIIDWIGTTTEELSRQIEQTEAEVEQLGTGGGKKTKKAQGDRLNELEELNERRQWHIGRMEVVQRMLENGQLEPEQVEAIQEDVNYFVEANTEEDFDYDQGIYDELNLQDEEDYNPDLLHNDELSNLDSASIADTNIETSSVIAPPPKTPMKEEKEKKATPVRSTSISIPSTSDDLPPQPPSPIAPKKTVSRKTTQDVKSAAVSSPAEVKMPAKSTPHSEAVPAPKAAPLPPIRYAAAAAAAVAATVAATVPNIPGPSASNADSIGSPVSKKMEPPMSTPGLDGPEQSSSQMVQSPETAPAPVKESAPQTNGHAPPPPPGLVQSPAPDAQEASHAAAPSLQAQNAISPQQTAGSAPPGYQLSLPPIAPAPHAESSRAGSGYSATSPRPTPQGVLGNLMQSFDVAKELSERRGNDINELHSALDASYANAPHQIDAEPPRYYHPKNPIKTPSYYPQTRPPILEDKTIYQRLDMDQLFYIFYYVTGGYEQWLAAQELKRQSWRFHKQYLTWFQRAHNPQAITEDYEQGGYYYFDWENSWCQRKKSDFRFEYRWLSDH